MDATLGWPASLLAVPLVSELVKTFKGTAVLMVGNLDLTPTRTLPAFSVADAYENDIACTDTFFIETLQHHRISLVGSIPSLRA